VDVEGKHKKQNGGSGQYGHVKIRFAPGTEEGLTFTVSVVGGSVPKNFYPAVEKGLLESMVKASWATPWSSLPPTSMTAPTTTWTRTKFHSVPPPTSPIKSVWSLPPRASRTVGNLDITVPDSLVGDVMGDLNKRRGSVMGMDPVENRKGYTTIHPSLQKRN
jgi:elongation factor G